ncbi:ribonuclease P protein component [Paracoccaceae bacterium]|nr:ribonuclease P protein component [Paracoccaceae bacterium]
MNVTKITLTTILKRRDFLLVAAEKRSGQPGLLLQGRNRQDGSSSTRVGYTCSKKLGNAIARNKAKRRLREISKATLTVKGNPGWDYVLVGRPKTTLERNYSLLIEDLNEAIKKVHS